MPGAIIKKRRTVRTPEIRRELKVKRIMRAKIEHGRLQGRLNEQIDRVSRYELDLSVHDAKYEQQPKPVVEDNGNEPEP
jgi:hypothetical protein